jgi:hypothetical protein
MNGGTYPMRVFVIQNILYFQNLYRSINQFSQNLTQNISINEN